MSCEVVLRLLNVFTPVEKSAEVDSSISQKTTACRLPLQLTVYGVVFMTLGGADKVAFVAAQFAVTVTVELFALPQAFETFTQYGCGPGLNTGTLKTADVAPVTGASGSPELPLYHWYVAAPTAITAIVAVSPATTVT